VSCSLKMDFRLFLVFPSYPSTDQIIYLTQDDLPLGLIQASDLNLSYFSCHKIQEIHHTSSVKATGTDRILAPTMISRKS